MKKILFTLIICCSLILMSWTMNKWQCRKSGEIGITAIFVSNTNAHIGDTILVELLTPFQIKEPDSSCKIIFAEEIGEIDEIENSIWNTPFVDRIYMCKHIKYKVKLNKAGIYRLNSIIVNGHKVLVSPVYIKVSGNS